MRINEKIVMLLKMPSVSLIENIFFFYFAGFRGTGRI